MRTVGQAEAACRGSVGWVEQRPDDLTAPRWVGAAVPVPLHHDHGPVLGLDDGAEVGPEGAFGAVAAGGSSRRGTAR